MKDITTEEAVKTLKDFCKYGLYHNDNTKHNTGKAIEKVLDELESEKENSELNTKCVQLEYQLEKKDKIIDAMAEYINKLNYIDDIECEFEARHNLKCPTADGIMNCQDCIKQYFERKVKDD